MSALGKSRQARHLYQCHQGYRGYDERWIEERLRADLIRNDLISQWAQ